MTNELDVQKVYLEGEVLDPDPMWEVNRATQRFFHRAYGIDFRIELESIDLEESR